MVFEGIIIGILVGYLRKGEINRIGNVRIKGKRLIISAFIIQISFLLLNTGLVDLEFNYYEALLTISYVLLLTSLILNWSIKYIPVILIGGIINLVSFIYNGWKIAIIEKTSRILFSQEIFNLLLEEEVELFKIIPDSSFFRGGFIPYDRLFIIPSALSIGDIIIFIGIVLVIQNIMISRRNQSMTNIKFSKSLFNK